MPGLDAKMFGVKDVIYILLLVIGGAGSYYAMNDRIGDLEDKVTTLEDENKAYINLPKDVQTMQKDIEANAKLTKAIYLGLVAKGIIKPPQ